MKKIWIAVIAIILIIGGFIILNIFDVTSLEESKLPIIEEGHQELIEDSFKKNAKVRRDKDLSFRERMQKADILAQDNYTTLAIKEYSLASQDEPKKSDPYLKIGIIHFNNNLFQKAKQILSKHRHSICS